MLSKVIYGSSGQDGQILKRILGQDQFICISKKKVDKRNAQIGSSIRKELISDLFKKFQIQEVYFLASNSTPATNLKKELDYSQFRYDIDLMLDDFILILETIKIFSPSTRIFFASSALIFGSTTEIPQSEKTPYKPLEIYSLFKVIFHQIIDFYRGKNDLLITSGILYPHESEFRNSNYLFRKVIDHAIQAYNQRELKHLSIANLEFKREWNCAYQVMSCAIKLLKVNISGDYVISSGIQYSVKDLCRMAYGYFGLDYKDFIEIKEASLIQRSSNLIGDSTKLYNTIEYKPDGDLRALIGRTFKAIELLPKS